MSVKSERQRAIKETIDDIRRVLADGVSVETLEIAKSRLMQLCARSELFPRSDFPLPEGDATERTFLVHEDDDGRFALYVNSGTKGQTYRPHDHGGAWAIVAAISGEERHRLYVRQADRDGDPERMARLDLRAELDVRPGRAVSLLEDGIHSIHALGEEPLLHLHLYGKRFADQGTRTEYDAETGEMHSFKLEDTFFIEDAR